MLFGILAACSSANYPLASSPLEQSSLWKALCDGDFCLELRGDQAVVETQTSGVRLRAVGALLDEGQAGSAHEYTLGVSAIFKEQEGRWAAGEQLSLKGHPLKVGQGVALTLSSTTVCVAGQCFETEERQLKADHLQITWTGRTVFSPEEPLKVQVAVYNRSPVPLMMKGRPICLLQEVWPELAVMNSEPCSKLQPLYPGKSRVIPINLRPRPQGVVAKAPKSTSYRQVVAPRPMPKVARALYEGPIVVGGSWSAGGQKSTITQRSSDGVERFVVSTGGVEQRVVLKPGAEWVYGVSVLALDDHRTLRVFLR